MSLLGRVAKFLLHAATLISVFTLIRMYFTDMKALGMNSRDDFRVYSSSASHISPLRRQAPSTDDSAQPHDPLPTASSSSPEGVPQHTLINIDSSHTNPSSSSSSHPAIPGVERPQLQHAHHSAGTPGSSGVQSHHVRLHSSSSSTSSSHAHPHSRSHGQIALPLPSAASFHSFTKNKYSETSRGAGDSQLTFNKLVAPAKPPTSRRKVFSPPSGSGGGGGGEGGGGGGGSASQAEKEGDITHLMGALADLAANQQAMLQGVEISQLKSNPEKQPPLLGESVEEPLDFRPLQDRAAVVAEHQVFSGAQPTTESHTVLQEEERGGRRASGARRHGGGDGLNEYEEKSVPLGAGTLQRSQHGAAAYVPREKLLNYTNDETEGLREEVKEAMYLREFSQGPYSSTNITVKKFVLPQRNAVRRRKDVLNPFNPELAQYNELHDGPFLTMKWPVDSEAQKTPMHYQLHKKLFVEHGSVTERRLHVDFPLYTQGGTAVFSRFYFHKSILEQIPASDARWSFDTCAVVSNSGMMLEHPWGQEIDLADAVLRMNLAQTVGYQKWVGSKTTFDFVNSRNANRVLVSSALTPGHQQQQPQQQQDPFNPKVQWLSPNAQSFRARKGRPKSGNSTLMMYDHIISELEYGEEWIGLQGEKTQGFRFQMIPALLQRFPHPSTVVMSPDFLIASLDLWKRILMSPEIGSQRSTCAAMKRRDGGMGLCKPATGWFALVFATQICKQVNLYGFSSWRKHTNNETAHQSKYHYFDSVKGYTNVHSFELSLRVFQLLAEHYPIQIK